MNDMPPDQDCDLGTSLNPERVLEVMLMFANGYAGQNLDDGSPIDPTYAVRRQGNNLLFTVTSESIEVTYADLQLLAERFKMWGRREDKALVREEFFQDLNRWGKTGENVIRRVLGLILLAEHELKELETKSKADFWEPLKRMLPRRFHFKATSERPAYDVQFSVVGDALLFKKNGVTTTLEREDVGAVWLRYVEFECMELGRDKDLELATTTDRIRWTQGPEAGRWKEYGYELACLMHVTEMQAALPDKPRRCVLLIPVKEGPSRIS